MPTITVARDEMFGAFRTAWNANTPGVTPDSTIPAIEYQGVEALNPPPADSPWASIRINHFLGAQATLGEPATSRKFDRAGVVTIEISTPKRTDPGQVLLEQLAIIARDAYEGQKTASQVWFRNVRIQEVGPISSWTRWAVLADFEYDETK